MLLSKISERVSEVGSWPSAAIRERPLRGSDTQEWVRRVGRLSGNLDFAFGSAARRRERLLPERELRRRLSGNEPEKEPGATHPWRVYGSCEIEDHPGQEKERECRQYRYDPTVMPVLVLQFEDHVLRLPATADEVPSYKVEEVYHAETCV